MAGLIKRLRRAAEDPGFDPGKPGQPSATYSFVMRLLDLLARSFLVKRPDALRRLIAFLIIFFSNPQNVASDALSPEEVRDLRAKFLRQREPEITDPEPDEPGEQEG
jgi:hypothetical protein